MDGETAGLVREGRRIAFRKQPEQPFAFDVGGGESKIDRPDTVIDGIVHTQRQTTMNTAAPAKPRLVAGFQYRIEITCSRPEPVMVVAEFSGGQTTPVLPIR